jgi:hypothetical protein
MDTAVTTPVTHNSLIGVWTRRYIRHADGVEDNSTQVWWLQAQPFYADLRIPASRPSFHGVLTLSECSAEHRNWLSQQHGFAGSLVNAENAWQWMREIDFQPTTEKRDIGTLTYSEANVNLLTEKGIDDPYLELWERIDDASSTKKKAFVLRRRNSRGHAILVAVGQHFLLAVDHRKTTSQSVRLDPLNMEISHGLRAGPISQWTITDSTFPWREGKPVFTTTNVHVNWRRRALTEAEHWEIVEPVTGKLDWIY